MIGSDGITISRTYGMFLLAIDQSAQSRRRRAGRSASRADEP
jgi:hypothetical protein